REPARQAKRADEPERAREERALPGQVVVAPDEGAARELAPDRLDRREHPRAPRLHVAEQGQREQVRVQLAAAGGADVRGSSGVEALLLDEAADRLRLL